MKIEEIYTRYKENYLVDTDTRKIRKNTLYFALKGDHFDGNKFANEALEKGAKYAVVDNEKFKSENTILVNDVLETLQQLATYHRTQLSLPIISLTGSNGKTTTKELINTVLSKKFKVSATKGNLNNHIGVPLTLLAMTPNTEIGLVEMGANHQKEIEFLSQIAQPNYGYVTNFGKAHLEGFGGVEGVIKGKSELYDYLRKNNGKAFVNSNDKLQLKQTEGIERISFGSKNLKFIDANPFVKLRYKDTEIQSNLIGSYNYSNIAAAIAIGAYFKVSSEEIKNAIESYVPKNNRSQIIKKKSNTIILDAYNANPSSMQVALENFSKLKKEPKIVFLGDMFELGESSLDEHQKIADLATSLNFEKVFLIGKAFSTVTAKNAFQYNSFENFTKLSNNLNFQNVQILIKGSRGMALERILDLL